MFSSDREVVIWSRQLAKELLYIDEGEWVSFLNSALAMKMEDGLLGKLRFELCKFEASDVPDKMEIRDRVESAIAVLDKALE